MKTYGGGGDGGIASRILNLGTKLRQVVSFMPRLFYSPGNSARYPLDRRLGEPKGRFGRSGEEKKIPLLPLPRIEPRSSSPNDLPDLYLYLNIPDLSPDLLLVAAPDTRGAAVVKIKMAASSGAVPLPSLESRWDK
jgi:hypothetical protein